MLLTGFSVAVSNITSTEFSSVGRINEMYLPLGDRVIVVKLGFFAKSSTGMSWGDLANVAPQNSISVPTERDFNAIL